MKVLVFILCIVVVVQSGPIGKEDSLSKVIINNFVNCLNSDINLCLKEHMLRATDRLRSVKKLKIYEGVTLYNHGAKKTRSFDTLSTDPEERNKQVTEKLWRSASELYQKSDLELSYGGDDADEGNGFNVPEGVEGRGKKLKALKQKLKILIPLAIIGKIKAIVLVVAALLVIAASVFKIALLAKIAFLAKVFAIVKALIAKKHLHQEHSYVPYEEHAHPVEHGWEGGWSRSRNEANGLAYSAYKQ